MKKIVIIGIFALAFSISIFLNIKNYSTGRVTEKVSDEPLLINNSSYDEAEKDTITQEEIQKYISQIAELTNQLQNKDIEITQLKQVNEDTFNPALYMADIEIGQLYDSLEYIKNNKDFIDSSKVLDNLVIPTKVNKNDKICNLIVEDVFLSGWEGLEFYLEGYSIKFNGEFGIKGKLSADPMDTNKFYLISEGLENLPFAPAQLVGNAMTIKINDSEGYLIGNGYKEGDTVEVKLKELILYAMAYKSMTNTAEFVQVIEE